jgi:hypothetical protein
LRQQLKRLCTTIVMPLNITISIIAVLGDFYRASKTLNGHKI